MSLPGALDALAGYGFPVMVVAYCLSVAWVRWRRGEVPLREGIARVAGS